jgi:hypothetical protein
MKARIAWRLPLMETLEERREGPGDAQHHIL